MLFLVAIFFLKTTSVFKNTETYQKNDPEGGLTYANTTLEDLVNKDTDQDGIRDWEEGLWGTDPTKAETTPGTADSVAINKSSDQSVNQQGGSLLKKNSQAAENLTETDKFSRELFATVATASQNGVMDQATIDTLSISLAEKIKNPIIKKTFSSSDIKTIQDDTPQAFTNYSNTINNIYTKYPMNNNVLNILERFIADGENVNENALLELDPIIGQMNKIIDALAKINVPQSVSTLHLNLLNAFERITENISDIRLFNTDTILSIGAITKYQENTDALVSAMNTLNIAVKQKFNN